MKIVTLALLIPFLSCIFLQTGCNDAKAPLKPRADFENDSLVAINPEYVPLAQLCTWKFNNKAAYSIAFDDVKSSHYQVAGPELYQRALVGTFNLNTQAVFDWSPWQALFDRGNEIASHTWSHQRCTTLSESELRYELCRAKYDILSNIKGISSVPSFTYPYGDSNESVRRIVAEYHSSARGNGGINDANIFDTDFYLIKGIGVYPPYDMNQLKNYVLEAMRKNGWILVYFHVVSEEGETGATTIPLDLFRQHLDDVVTLKDSLWIATQGEIADYIRSRTNSALNFQILDQENIQVTLTSSGKNGKTWLSFLLFIPKTWLGYTVIALNPDSNEYQVLTAKHNPVLLNIAQNSKLKIFALNRNN